MVDPDGSLVSNVLLVPDSLSGILEGPNNLVVSELPMLSSGVDPQKCSSPHSVNSILN